MMEPIITEKQMYWITRLDDIQAGLAASGLILGIGGFILLVMSIGFLCDKDGIKDNVIRTLRQLRVLGFVMLPLGLLFGIARVFTPSTAQYAAIKVIPAIANNERARTDAAELYDLAVTWARESLRSRPRPAERQ